MTDYELRMYHRRKLLFGLSDRMEDRHLLRSMLSQDPRGEEPINWPVAVAEEYERRDEVEKFIASYPQWNPIVLYFSKNPALQDTYPMLTEDMFYRFLKQHRIGSCIFALVDHETDNFVLRYPHSQLGRDLLFRYQTEKRFARFASGLVSQVYDNPWMFHYLDAERLKTLDYYYKNYARYKADPARYREFQMFGQYMTKSLDGHNLKLDDKGPELPETGDVTACKTPHEEQTPKQETKPVKTVKPSARTQRFELLEEVQACATAIKLGLMHPEDAHVTRLVRDNVEIISQHLNEIKQMHRQLQKKFLVYIRNIIDTLKAVSLQTGVSHALVSLCQTSAQRLEKLALSNGERAKQRVWEKEQEEMEQAQKDRQAMKRAKRREASKKKRQAEQRLNDIQAQAMLSPQERQQNEEAKLQRRQQDKARKIKKEQLKAERKKHFSQPRTDDAQTPQETQIVVENVVVRVVENPSPKTIHPTKIISDGQPLRTAPKEPFYMPLVQRGHCVRRGNGYVRHVVRSGRSYFRGNN
ncbi:MAG: cell envelope integrity protein TolA [Alphaproteobacteria bacterium]|nr:cell envelope integrity protein TolA [Alphaproteobacteria bacterium]